MDENNFLNMIGKGKNLEALLKARQALSPDVDVPWKTNFELVGQPYDTPGNFQTVGEAYDPRSKDLVVRAADDVVPVLDDAARAVVPTTGRVISEKPSILSRFLGGAKAMASSPVVQGAAKFLGNPAVQVGMGMLEPADLDDTEDARMQQINSTLKAQSELEDPSNLMSDIENFGKERAQFVSNPNNMSVGTPAQFPSISEVEDKKEVEETNPIKNVLNKNQDAMKLLQALQSDNSSGLSNALLRAAVQIGSGIAGTKADYSGVEALEKSGKVSDQVKEVMSAQDRDKKKDQENEFSDPKSQSSNIARKYLKSLGYDIPDDVSAATLEKSGVKLGTILGYKENEKARKESAEEKRLLKEREIEAKKLDKTNKLNDDKKKFAQSLRKEATTGAFGKQYENFAAVNRSVSALEEFAKNPSAYKDYGALMLSLKGLQGDSSVVREAEVRLGMSATSLKNSLMNNVQRTMTGKSLQPQQRKEMIQAVEALKGVSASQYMDSIKPLLEQADMEGIDKSIILPAGLEYNKLEENVPKEKNTQKETTMSVQAPHGYRVRQNGKVYIWDGAKYIEEKQ